MPSDYGICESCRYIADTKKEAERHVESEHDGETVATVFTTRIEYMKREVDTDLTWDDIRS